jgi:hypothetical protein
LTQALGGLPCLRRDSGNPFPVHEATLQQDSVFRRETREGAANDLRFIVAFEGLEHIRTGVWDRILEGYTALPKPQLIGDHMAQDAVGDGADFFSGLDPPQSHSTDQSGDRLLYRVLGIVGVGQTAAGNDGQAVDQPRKALLQGAPKLLLRRSGVRGAGHGSTVRPLAPPARVPPARVRIDDFGTGYSALAYLHELPVSGIKLDRSWFRHIDESAEQREIVRVIVALAHRMDMDVVAEGRVPDLTPIRALPRISLTSTHVVQL